jgi:hypothetical protein
MNQLTDPKGNEVNSKARPSVACGEARRLLDVFGEAVQDLIKLHEQQLLAAVDGDLSANRFDLLIHDANHRKQVAKYAYMTHLEEHGC